ncbi:MAG TPA: protease inhibitor I42 family protein [Mucilaginibacter sp.]|jgi:predicted secreted protein|nr:protease inhibitor I42 family protein [Mucilaginibacter sp.]
MSTKFKLIITLFVVAVIISACNKTKDAPAPVEIKITALQNGKPVTLTQGQTLDVTLQNPGDGLYSFDQPKYDVTVLRFVDHLHQGPTNNNVGNYGMDSWDFVAIKPGSTTFTITATRGADKSTTVTMLSSNVSVK